MAIKIKTHADYQGVTIKNYQINFLSNEKISYKLINEGIK